MVTGVAAEERHSYKQTEVYKRELKILQEALATESGVAAASPDVYKTGNFQSLFPL